MAPSWNDDPVVTTAEPWQEDPIEPFSVSKTIKNIPSDIKGIATGAFNLAKPVVDPLGITESAMKGSFDPMIERATGQTGREAFKQAAGIPGGLIEEGKRIGIGELATGHPINAANQFTSAFQEKPVSTALDVAPFLSPFMKGAPVEAPLAEEAASTAAKVAPETASAGLRSAVKLRGKTYVGEPGELHVDVIRKIAETEGIPESEVYDVVNKIGDQGFAKGNEFLTRQEAAAQTGVKGEAASLRAAGKLEPEGTFENLKRKIPQDIQDPMKQVGEYLKKQYGQTAGKPGMANIAADYLKEHAQNMNLKEMGAAPGQVRKIGVERAHELADYAEQNDLVGPKIGTQGRERLVAKKLEDAGGAVGAFRKMATDRGAIHDPETLVNQVRANLDAKYLKGGMHSGQKGTYAKALQELKNAGKTPQEMADKVTEMFKEAKNQNPLGKPTGPLADVAHQVRDLNQKLIKQHLSPEEMTLYEKSLEDYGALTQIREFVKRRSSTEAGGRLGPGSGISRAAVQKFLDAFGYRTEARIASKLADYIRKNPDVMSRPKDIFRNYADEAAEAVHEMGEAHQ